jgi:DNA-binding response OmpR family regulator
MPRALIIKESDSTCFEGNVFLQQAKLQVDAHHSGQSALAAYRTGHYRHVFVSMALQREDPFEIIRLIRDLESELGLAPAQIVVSAPEQQPSDSDIQQYNICGIIRSHHMR